MNNSELKSLESSFLSGAYVSQSGQRVLKAMKAEQRGRPFRCVFLYVSGEGDEKVSRKYFQPLSAFPLQHTSLGYLPRHAFDSQKGEGTKEDSQNMLTSFL